MVNYIPDQGDIVMIDFDPSVGKEIQKRRSALVMSKQLLTKHTGMILVCPITSTRRGIDLEVEISTPSIEGVALSIQIKSMDYRLRNAEYVDKADWQAVQSMSEKLIELLAV